MSLRIILLFFVLGFAGYGCGNVNSKNVDESVETIQKNEGVQWVYNLDEGIKKAKQVDKPLMVDFYADWCVWCKRLDQDVYSDKNVQNLLQNFISVKVDTEKYPVDARKYGVTGLPTIYFLKSDGEVLDAVIGYKDSKQFAKILSEIIER